MRANTIALSALLLSAGLLSSVGTQAAITRVSSVDPVPAATRAPSDTMQFADGGKLNDKYMVGKSGGATGVGTKSAKSKSGNTQSGTSQAGKPPPERKKQ
jgi:hypothetical protein